MLPEIGQIPFTGLCILDMQPRDVGLTMSYCFKRCRAPHRPPNHRRLLVLSTHIVSDEENRRIAASHDDLILNETVVTQQLDLYCFRSTP